MFDRKFITTAGIAILSLFLFAVFPAEGYFQLAVVVFTFLLVIPLLYIKMILKEDLKNYGLRKGDWKIGIFFGGLAVVISLLAAYLLSHYTNFSQEYVKTLPKSAVAKFVYFAFYELIIVGFFAALYEFFYRGFAMLGLFRKSGNFSILAQFILLSSFLAITGNFNWHFAPYLITGFTAGITAFRSRSLIYSFAASWISIIIIDAFVIWTAK